MSFLKAFLHFLQRNAISCVLTSGWSDVSAWHILNAQAAIRAPCCRKWFDVRAESFQCSQTDCPELTSGQRVESHT
jgi:hypothetical protein